MFSHASVTPYRRTIYPDLFLLLVFLIFLHYFIGLAEQWNGSFHSETLIDLSYGALPRYAFFSLIRAFIAYFISLTFSLVYGYVAAKNKSSERFMIPLLDIGQSIPVLGFMPGLVLGLIALFPNSNIGMELACIILIFTGQVWNMTFSFYSSLRAVPETFYEMSDVVGLGKWSKFRRIELPFSAITLAWNSLMSMAGGWFFLIACESFTLGERNFRLPGLGAYMAVAAEQNNTGAIIAGGISMCLIILVTDFLIWRPVIAWTRKFRLEEVQDDIEDTPFLTLLLQESFLMRVMTNVLSSLRGPVERVRKTTEVLTALVVKQPTEILIGLHVPGTRRRKLALLLQRLGSKLFLTLMGVLLLWAAFSFWELVRGLQGPDWRRILVGTSYTFLRVTTALIIGSIWTIPFGIWVGLSQRLTRFFQPIVQLGASFPAPMIYPIALALFAKMNIGLPISSAFLMLLGVQWYILFNVLAGAIGISRELRENFDLVGVSGRYRWTTLYLPSVFPALLTGWITAAGGAWNASIVAEYVQYRGVTVKALGLGSLISEATAAGNYPLLAGCLIIMVIVVVGINRILWRPIQRLAENRYRFER